MRVTNHVPELLAEKFGGTEPIDLHRIAHELGVSYVAALRWSKREVHRIDTPILEKWCEYLHCQPGDILKYED